MLTEETVHAALRSCFLSSVKKNYSFELSLRMRDRSHAESEANTIFPINASEKKQNIKNKKPGCWVWPLTRTAARSRKPLLGVANRFCRVALHPVCASVDEYKSCAAFFV